MKKYGGERATQLYTIGKKGSYDKLTSFGTRKSWKEYDQRWNTHGDVRKRRGPILLTAFQFGTKF